MQEIVGNNLNQKPEPLVNQQCIKDCMVVGTMMFTKVDITMFLFEINASKLYFAK